MLIWGRRLFEDGVYLKVWSDIIIIGIIINCIQRTKNVLIFNRKLKQQRQRQLRKRHL